MALVPVLASAADDAVLIAASAALQRGRAVEAMDLMRDHSRLGDYGSERLLLARCQVSVGDGDTALKTNSAADIGTVWPEPLRAQAFGVAAEAAISAGREPSVAVSYLQSAIAGGGMVADRALMLLAEQSKLAGDLSLSVRCAE